MTQDEHLIFDLDESFPHLAAAPIVEAAIHWLARSARPFEAEILQRQLAERLPDYPDRQTQHELQVEAQWGGDSSAAATHHRWRGLRVTSLDKTYIAQFSRDGLVFSRLAPYTKWDEFSAEARRVWKVFSEVAEPTEVERLGVRFINRITLRSLTDVSRYLAKAPKCLEALNLPMSGFHFQSAHAVPGHSLRIGVVQTVQPPAPPQIDGYGLILDIDVGTTEALPTSADVLDERLAQMHWLKNKVFFSLLSKKALAFFQKGKA